MSELTAAEVPPLPVPTDLTRFYWEGARQRTLLILRCQKCGHFVHYPRPICDQCQSDDLAPEKVCGRGVVYSHTIVMQAFHPYFCGSSGI